MTKNFVTSIPDSARRVCNTADEYVDLDGSVYKRTRYGKFLKKSLFLNNKNGYLYVGISFADGRRTVRVHRLVAQTFIDNPCNYPVVGHKNNRKSDNHVSNLYWTTISENTQKAYDDGIAVNDKGVLDSQSTPVAFLLNDGTLLSVYGSRTLAARLSGKSKTTICRQTNKGVTSGKFGYYFKVISEVDYSSTGEILRDVNF